MARWSKVFRSNGAQVAQNEKPQALGASESEAPFEQVLSRLQQVVERLEQGDLPLEESLAIFEEGVRLSRIGARRLDEAERRVEQLLGEGQELRTEPLASTQEHDDDD